MGMGEGEGEACIDEEGSQDECFTCPYCESVYGSRSVRDRCKASHFRGTGSVTRKPRSEDKKKNIVDEWKKS